MPQSAPDDLDYAMLKAAMEFAQQIYATHGGMPPIAMVQLPPQPDGKIMHMVMPCDKMTTAEEKRRFIQSVHYAELEHNGRRSCLVAESWQVITNDPARSQLLEEIRSRGGSLSEHPDAVEVVSITVQSDNGYLAQCMRLHRHHANFVELEPIDTPSFSGNDYQGSPAGRMTGHHVPTSIRSAPQIKQYHAELRQMFKLETLLEGASDSENRPMQN